jgi:hypothetical protein
MLAQIALYRRDNDAAIEALVITLSGGASRSSSVATRHPCDAAGLLLMAPERALGAACDHVAMLGRWRMAPSVIDAGSPHLPRGIDRSAAIGGYRRICSKRAATSR